MEKIIKEFNGSKNGTVVRIRVTDFDFKKGKLYVDIRKFFKSPKGYEPMRTGICIPSDRISEYVTALEQAEAEVKK